MQQNLNSLSTVSCSSGVIIRFLSLLLELCFKIADTILAKYKVGIYLPSLGVGQVMEMVLYHSVFSTKNSWCIPFMA